MAFHQTRDVLEHVRTFHQTLSLFYEELKDSSGKERTRILLDYMCRHEQYLVHCMAQFEEQVSDSVLDTYFQYESERTPLDECTDSDIKPEMDADDVLTVAMKFDNCLIRFYREMAQRSVSGKVREVFENLLEMEKQEQIELSKKVLGMQSL